MSVQAKGYQLTDVGLSNDNKWPVALTSGLADVKVRAELNGQQLRAQGGASLSKSPTLVGQGRRYEPPTQSLSSAVRDISELSIDADVKGTLDQYDVALSSDLDRILQNAAGKMVNDLAAKFGAELQTAISAKIAEPMQQLKKNLAGFDGMANEFTERVSEHNDVLKNLLEKNLPVKGLKDLPGGLKSLF
ncbi:MAG: hypothetical protein R3B74_10390 [Nitrospirales bacterium]|nr:hypothetical protein [Nitrospirales bacterium]